MRTRNLWAVGAAMLVVASACSEPQSSKPHAQLSLPGGATLAVAVTSTGADIDPNGYTVWVDASRSQAIGANGLVTFSGLAAGNHAVALYGIASNCGVNTLSQGPNNPRGVTLIEGVLGSTNFDVRCSSWGGLFVSARTTGLDLDADGYTITVDGGASQAIATNGSVTFTELYEGSHSVAISGVAGNCTLSGPTSRTVTVSPGETASVAFSASCAPTGSGSGTLTVTTTSTGSNLDPDGYTVTVDGTFSQAIATTDGTVTFTGPAGGHPVVLSGMASNCTVSGDNPRTVSVPADGAATTTFSVTCGVPQASVIGKGQVGIGSPTPHNNVYTFDFDVRADLTGRLKFIAWDDMHSNGSAATVTADPSTDSETSIRAFRNTSAVCADPSRGAEFDGVGRFDEGYVAGYTVVVCDDGPEGSGRDFVSLYVPSEGNGRSGMVTSGDIVKK